MDSHLGAEGVDSYRVKWFDSLKMFLLLSVRKLIKK